MTAFESAGVVRGRVVAALRGARRILLTGHVGVDGDALGSAVALWHGLRRLGKDPVIALSEPVPPLFRFLVPDGACAFLEDTAGAAALVDELDVAVVLDNNAWDRLGYLESPLREGDVRVLCVDHHLADEPFCQDHWIETDASATGVMAFDLLEQLGVELDSAMASALWVALANDTGWFRFDNTDVRTLTVARALVAAGAAPGEINESMNAQLSLAALKVRGRFFENLEEHEGGRVVLGCLSRAEIEGCGATDDDTEVLVGLIRRLRGTAIVGFLREQPDGTVKLSFRSRPGWSARDVALRFGGGGHEVAAGAPHPGPLAKAREDVLEAIGAMLRDTDSATAGAVGS